MFQSGPAAGRRSLRTWGIALLATGVLAGAAAAWARSDVPSGGVSVALSALPPEARTTQRLILSGGPFPYRKDGTVFFNRERLLPLRERGYYREYTVKTPGSPDRGARRIVCGGEAPRVPDACWYTADHYASFRRIVTAP